MRRHEGYTMGGPRILTHDPQESFFESQPTSVSDAFSGIWNAYKKSEMKRGDNLLAKSLWCMLTILSVESIQRNEYIPNLVSDAS